jgi:putative transposase
MLRSIKYELNPTNGQKRMLNQAFGNCRFVYNWALNEKIKAYQEDKKTLSCFDLIRELTQLKKREGFEWLNLSGAQQLQQSISNLDRAFSNFFKAKKGFPKFKSKHNKQSFRIPQSVKINFDEYKFFVPKVGWVKFFKDKHIEGEIKFATVSKSTTGRYYVSITFESTQPRKTGSGVVGVDLGIKYLAITSDGEFFENQKYLRQNLKKLKREQRSLSRKFQKGKKQSNNYRKQRLKVAKIHEKISNQRKDYLHKLTTYLATTYETVCIEDLAVENMVKNHRLALAIHDCGWGMFRQMLEYKVKDLRIIGRFQPSSRMCNICGDINKNLKLSDRNWTCSNGHSLNRDLNAALNIKNFGLRASTLNAKTDHKVISCSEHHRL